MTAAIAWYKIFPKLEIGEHLVLEVAKQATWGRTVTPSPVALVQTCRVRGSKLCSLLMPEEERS